MKNTTLGLAMLVLPLLVACGKCTKKEPASKNKPAAPMTTMKPWPRIDYTAGHALTPKAALLAWLQQNARKKGRRTLFKLPVVVTAKEGFVIGRLRAFVATSTKDPGTDKLHLDLDGGALGVSLADYLQMRCGKSANACALWLEGHWGPHLERGPRLPASNNQPPKAHPFTIRHVGSLIKANTQAKAMIAR